ncbi:hypothetical protein GE061_005890 [Apolygus lucorum]|uniref:Uncharacterized protein n=1 Tax=Apolygus lucorum TaxID=248454 RepID=A0A8S9WZB4_APOLU|nr:hypothetical protein GE061_005890 [Apolygus lucorum]
MSGGKDLYAMFTDVERRLNQGVDRDESQCDEPVEEPALPRPRVSAIEPSEVVRETIDIDREWGVLESGVEMMCNATNAEDRKHGWHRYASALKLLKGCTRSRHTIASPTIDVNHLADAVALKLRQPPVVGPTPREIAREVVEMLQEKVTLTNPKLAEEIAELVCQRQSPAYSPVHDAGAIADAILNKLKGQVNLSLCLPEPTTTIPPAPESLHPEDLMEDAPQDNDDLPQESDHPAEERRCLACKQPRTRHSRLWCEACRVFLRRSHKATAEGRPFACHNLRHQQKPDFENCRGTIEGIPDQNTTTPRKEYFDTPVVRHIETPIATSDIDVEMPDDRDFGTAAAISFDRDVDTTVDTTVATSGQDSKTSLERSGMFIFTADPLFILLNMSGCHTPGGGEGKSSSKDPIFLKVMDLIRPQTDPLQIDQEDQECATALKTSTSTRLQEMTAESDWSHSNPAVLKTPHASVPRTWIESSNSPDGCLILEEADDSMFKIDSGQNAAARPVSSQALRTADHPGRRPVLKRSNHQHSLEVEILKLRRDQEKIKLEQEKEKLLQLKLRTAHLKRKLRDGDDWDFM